MIFKNKNTSYIQCFFVESFCHLWQIQFHTILGCRMPPPPITFIHTSLPLKILVTNINVSLDLYIAHSYVNLHLYIIFIKKISFYMGLV
jgi:hypothetical protein